MGPAAAAVANLFFLVLATTFFSAAAQASDNSMAQPSTVWINNAASVNFINPNPFPPVRPIVIHILDASGYNFALGAGFVCVSANRSDMFFFAVFFVSFYNNPYQPGLMHMLDMDMIWSANRDRPVSENATLEFTLDGNLVLRDADDSHIWSSNSSGRSVAGMAITKIGNLVLFDHRNATVWQSFHHPTDTMILGQSLVEGMRLTANTSTTNTTGSKFYITVLPDGLYGYVESAPPQLYFSFTGEGNPINYPINITFKNGSINVLLQSTIQYDHNNVPLLATNHSGQYMRIESDGHLRLYGYDQSVVGTLLDDVMPIDYCDYPTACGEYGICDGGQCMCPVDDNSSSNYFKLVDERKPNLGCTPITPISCQEIQHHQFLTMVGISYFDKNATVLNALSIDDCQQACLKNCSCMAVLFRYKFSGDSECIFLTKIFSLQSLQPGNYAYINSTAYLKVQTSPFKENKKKVMVGVTLGSITTLVLLVIVVILYLQKRRNNEAEGEEFDFDQLPGMPTRFCFQTLSECTEGFSTKLGEGGFGSVFEGKLGEERVAVKRLEGARQGKKEFLAEIETIGSIEHINLVSLIGFCAEKTERLLVYEYMSRGSLDRWIYYRHNNGPLDWCIRSRIILDIAKGLCYLHEQCKQKIAHLDIKPQNILLDDNFNAKVADFGLCKLINRDQSKVMTVMRGTPGYLAPEWLTSRITEKVDVYSFGVVMMEIVSGRKNIDHSQPEEEIQLINLLREKAQNNQLIDLIDKHSDDVVSHQEEVIQMMKLAIWCLQNDSIGRPSMSTVIKVLEGAMSVETYDPNSVMYVPDNISTYSVPQASLLSNPR